jgi:haloalkane dehalogenase
MTNQQHVDFKPSPELFPFQSRFYSSSIGRLHYIDEGQGRPIVLLHGNPTWSFLYRKVIPELCARGFRCIAVDYPGHGLSVHPEDYGYTASEHASIVSELIDHLKLQDLLLMGQDWGGPIAVDVAARAPARIAGLVLGSTFCWPLDGAIMRLIAKLMRSQRMHRYIVDGEKFIERVLRLLSKTPFTDEEIDHYRLVAPSPPFRRGIAVLPKQLLDAAPWLADLERSARARLATKPLLLFRAGRERLLGNPFMRRFQSIFTKTVIVDLPKAGHFIQEDAPVAIADAIRDWSVLK